MTAEVRAGAADSYAATNVPAGQVGLWCVDSSDNTLDDFDVRDIAGPFEVDGRYFCSNGQVRVDNSDNNVLEAYQSAAIVLDSVKSVASDCKYYNARNPCGEPCKS